MLVIYTGGPWSTHSIIAALLVTLVEYDLGEMHDH